MFKLNTGDILLFDTEQTGIFSIPSKIIKYFTGSPFSHIGIILVDPIYLDPELKGIFLWESGIEKNSDPQDNKQKIGVRLTKIDDIVNTFKGKLYLRKLNNNDKFTINKIKDIHKKVYMKPYDINPIDWFEALIEKDNKPQKTDRFWCSAFVGYVYTKCGILNKDTDWSIMRPSDFSIKKQNLQYISNTKLDNRLIKFTIKKIKKE